MALMEASQKAAKMGDSDDLRKQLDQLRQKTIATEADLKENNSKLNNQVSELTTQLLNANKKAEDLNAELETCKVSYKMKALFIQEIQLLNFCSGSTF